MDVRDVTVSTWNSSVGLNVLELLWYVIKFCAECRRPMVLVSFYTLPCLNAYSNNTIRMNSN